MHNIRLLEELSLNAWPALQTLTVDGWVVRFAGSYSRRSNSVNPLYAPQGDVRDSIAACEALFAARGRPAVFKLTPAAQPPELDALLAQRGYGREAPTAMHTLDLRAASLPPAPGVITAAPALSDDWFAAVVAISGLDPAHHATARAMLASIVPAACFAYTVQAGQPVACGLAVAERGHVGFLDVAVHPDHRRQGHARRLMLDLLAWGQAQGAHTAYLQVMGSNAAALRLYEQLGFKEQYQYWYRVQAK